MSNITNLQDKKEVLVIDLFLNTQENSVQNIAKKSGLLETTVHKIINKYLKNRTINGRY